MMTRMHFAIAVTLGLVGCGGGGSSSTISQPTQPYSANLLKVFNDDAGIIKLVDNDTSNRIYVLTPDAAAVATEINTNGIEADPSSNFSGLTVTDTTSLAHADIATGTITVGGVGANVTAFKDRTSDSIAMLITVPNLGSLGLVGGSAPLSNLPSGNFTYVGTELVTPRLNTNNAVLGTFSMSADFTAGTATYNGTTSNSTMVANNIVVNTSTGDFATSTGTLTYNGTPLSTSMYGSFNGASAVGVSGVYFTNDTNGTYEGGFIGHKQ